MSVVGKYVNTFAEASHALPAGMHMNSDYPLMMPRIHSLTDLAVTLIGRQAQLFTAPIEMRGKRQVCRIAQTSSYETLFKCPPTEFTFYPFKDEKTPAIAEPSTSETGSGNDYSTQPGGSLLVGSGEAEKDVPNE